MKAETTEAANDKRPAAGWRIRVAFALFIVSIFWPVLVPIMPLIGISGGQIAAFSGAMVVLAEVMILAGVAIAGKEGFAYVKAKVMGILKAYGPPKTVGPTRYAVGLVMFAVPLVVGFLSPYLEHFQAAQFLPQAVAEFVPGRAENVLTLALVFDIMLVTSLFVLGGDFWDKLRSLFIHDARATFPG